jgi:hypothetical protein
MIRIRDGPITCAQKWATLNLKKTIYLQIVFREFRR